MNRQLKESIMNKSMLHFFLIGILFVACSDDEGTSVEKEIEEPYEWVQTHTIGGLLEDFGNAVVDVDTIAITGIVISSDEQKNVENELYISDDSEALVIGLQGSDLYQSFPVGSEVLVKCVGLQVDTDSKRLTLPDGASIVFSSQDSTIFRTGESGNTSIESVSLPNIDDSYLNRYIRFGGYQFPEEAVGGAYAQNNALTKWELTNANGDVANLVFSPNSTFADNLISTKRGNVSGLLSKVDDEYIIKVMSLEDMTFNTDRRAPFEKMEFVLGDNTLPYQIMFPQDYDNNSSYPLVVFLHGAGEKGTNNTSQMAFGPDTFGNYEARTSYPAIVIFPQCPCSSAVQWSRREISTSGGERIFTFPVEEEPNYAMEMVIELVRKLIDEEAVDTQRIYVTGLSMGGIGTFEFLYYAPDLPAAAAPMAGGYDSALVKTFPKEVAFRIHHGADDNVVPTRYSREMNLKLEELGYDVEYYEAEGRGHQWNYVLDDQSYIEWMFDQVRQ